VAGVYECGNELPVSIKFRRIFGLAEKPLRSRKGLSHEVSYLVWADICENKDRQ
jgi:hypothetical protein